jgi:hypothetical protein
MRFWKFFVPLIYISITAHLYSQVSAEYDDVKIIEQNDNHIILNWQMANPDFMETEIEGQLFLTPMFDNNLYDSRPGQPLLPYRLITVGIPENISPDVTVLNKDYEIKQNILITPAAYIYRDPSGISASRYEIDPEKYFLQDTLSLDDYYLLPPGYLRTLPVQQIRVNPFRYDPVKKELTIINRITIKIDYPPRSHKSTPGMLKKDKLESVLEKVVLNYPQAKDWKSKPSVKLTKPILLPQGDWYKFSLNADGVYRITPAVLQNAGINIAALPISSIQIYNNSGHALSYNVNAPLYNAPFTQEIPLYIKDQNNNGLFDGNDYILFYGKHVNGWFYETATREFDYHMNPYARSNTYLLTVSGAANKVIEKNILPSIPSADKRTYFIDRYHFEEDKYNILSSGPDWYGHRFFGLSGDFSMNFNLDFSTAAEVNPTFRIQLKGGSGAFYGDNKQYRYYFTILLNNQLVYNNTIVQNHTRTRLSKTLTSSGMIRNGSNAIRIQYSAVTHEQSSAYLDYFEVFYPRDLKASDNYLNFYTHTATNPVRFIISGFTAVNDLTVWDVSSPVNPVLLGENISGGSDISVDFEQIANQKNLIAFSLSSGQIKTVSNISRIENFQNLLDTGNQADFLIITHNSFVPYAERIAALRSMDLTGKVITLEDIYHNFNSGVSDPTAIRNFIRYAAASWRDPAPSFVLLFGDGHYDYRNIQIADTMRVPTFQIYDSAELGSRTTDNYFVDLNYASNDFFTNIYPGLAIGRIPVRNITDADNYLRKLEGYLHNPSRDGWQTYITLVADDQYTNTTSNETDYQNHSEQMSRLAELKKFNINKVYLSAYPSAPGGFSRVKPGANTALMDYVNQGSLIINYMGHGAPSQWTHEETLVKHRDLGRFNNPGKLPFIFAATCDFGKYDNPYEVSFTEELIWKENSGAIGVMAAARLVNHPENYALNNRFIRQLFAEGKPSSRLGEAWLRAVSSGANDQKYHLFADPTMYLNDPRGEIYINEITPDTLKALSKATIKAEIRVNDRTLDNFFGKAMLIVNDARFDSVITDEAFKMISLPGPMIFKGEISVNHGIMRGSFIVPKSIRYKNRKIGRATLYGWEDEGSRTAIGYVDSLLLLGSLSQNDTDGPEISIWFKDQENFSSGDILGSSPVLIAKIEDASGINITGEVGHIISLQLNDLPPKNISGFFSYNLDSYSVGMLQYPMESIGMGEHMLKITAFDNVNNPGESQVIFKVSETTSIALGEVVNYPNPFSGSTRFTFQTNRSGADITIKIYTLTGRLIQELYGISYTGYNMDIEWDGRDRDGDLIANGVYLYKIILNDGKDKKEQIEKLVILR